MVRKQRLQNYCGLPEHNSIEADEIGIVYQNQAIKKSEGFKSK